MSCIWKQIFLKDPEFPLIPVRIWCPSFADVFFTFANTLDRGQQPLLERAILLETRIDFVYIDHRSFKLSTHCFFQSSASYV